MTKEACCIGQSGNLIPQSRLPSARSQQLSWTELAFEEAWMVPVNAAAQNAAL